MRNRVSTSGSEPVIDVVRDEFSRLRRNLFEMVEATGMPKRQEDAWKSVIRTVTYDSQATVEGTLRRGENNARITTNHS